MFISKANEKESEIHNTLNNIHYKQGGKKIRRMEGIYSLSHSPTLKFESNSLLTTVSNVSDEFLIKAFTWRVDVFIVKISKLEYLKQDFKTCTSGMSCLLVPIPWGLKYKQL